MVTYEITAVVEPGLCSEFEKYMRDKHIPDLIKTGYFDSAEMKKIESGTFVVRYFCESMEMLEKYLDTAAEHLRRDFLEHFPEGVKLERKIDPAEPE